MRLRFGLFDLNYQLRRRYIRSIKLTPSLIHPDRFWTYHQFTPDPKPTLSCSNRCKKAIVSIASFPLDLSSAQHKVQDPLVSLGKGFTARTEICRHGHVLLDYWVSCCW